MPTHYVYKCTACGKTEDRYRNARKSRCCHANVVRLTTVIKSHLELEECQGEMKRVISAAAELRTAFFAACPESAQDARFFEMMGDPVCVIGHVAHFLQALRPITEGIAG